ncbi:hypothetical protein J1N35_025487 [Gossypium stocksii]|uniref:Uncharacterized protein n=1 Tax=Gossypium stocksii TaxID=47602 RepID=A0A9D3ZXW1_9ROSI|nr:hypothetical protein J1N35_025487 [Gossypium stocksii]
MNLSMPHGRAVARVVGHVQRQDCVIDKARPCARHSRVAAEADAMSQTWSYTGSPLSVLMPCPIHGLTLTHIQADAMSQTWSCTSLQDETNAMSQTWSYTSTRINTVAMS